ncbi:MAG: DNA polymerase Y family protein [Gammaproteobacteria bacterium]
MPFWSRAGIDQSTTSLQQPESPSEATQTVLAEPEATPGETVQLWLCIYLPALTQESRNRKLDEVTLYKLADWAIRFTPVVSISSGHALLLEIQGSLRLFKGLDRLWARVAHGLHTLKYATGDEVLMACAPTHRAALWLARAGVKTPVRSHAQLRQILAVVELQYLGWPARTVQALSQMGVTTVGECLRLPRAGLARRLGPDCVRALDQALGRYPDPQILHTPSICFDDELELPAESSNTILLLAGFQQLFGDLQKMLEKRQASVRGVWCRFKHPGGQETRLRLGLQQAAGPLEATSRLPELLGLRLAALALTAPVVCVALRATLEPGQVPTGRDLLGDNLLPEGGIKVLLERLRARLGEQAVQGVALRAEHRPEKAWYAVLDPLAASGGHSRLPVSSSRPVWLLPVPQRLPLIAGQPAWQGKLVLEQGPERIESGWWDGDDVRRDYYRASNPEGSMLWVYRDLRSQHWYLQGMFG